jgi:purine-binding chemotaxis protein CheW
MELMVFDFLKGTYAIDLSKIKVILVYSQMNITPLYAEKKWIKGVLNLRGEVAPVVDLRVRFGMDNPEYNENTVIMIIKTSEDKLIGITVDQIREIKTIKKGSISHTPEIGISIDPKYIHGLLRVGKKEMITILDIDKVLQINELA